MGMSSWLYVTAVCIIVAAANSSPVAATKMDSSSQLHASPYFTRNAVNAPSWHRMSPMHQSRKKERRGLKKPFNLTDFVGHDARFHPFEMAHMYQGDIRGVSTHVEVDTSGHRHRRVNLWPNGVVPYIVNGSFTEWENETIHWGIHEFHKKTCVRFVPRQRNEANYVIIQSNPTGCWSYIGRRNQPQPLNLEPRDCTTRNTIVHELMHAIGFIHEQSRPDRDKYINIHLENLKDPSEANNFKINPDLYVDLGIPYDINSAMQYDEFTFAIDDKKPTMTAKNGKRLGNHEGFSQSDIQEINLLYGCRSKIKSRGRRQTTRP